MWPFSRLFVGDVKTRARALGPGNSNPAHNRDSLGESAKAVSLSSDLVVEIRLERLRFLEAQRIWHQLGLGFLEGGLER
jgi:hypothetical protein